ncbi:hypothetical protein B0H14DRAFT_3430299 [Mycena olivaceomarginata]|nr:hypothetical protein B0H14DRAFT_3430299 [Mycena olivaceomarginata]
MSRANASLAANQARTSAARLHKFRKRIDTKIATERAQIAIPPEQSRLRNKATIGVFAQMPGNVEIVLIYAVPHASDCAWAGPAFILLVYLETDLSQAHITNASDYTLLSGTANVYVDGCFIARSMVPSISLQENLDCPLGLDPSIRITYPPISKQVSQSDFYKKSATHGFTQRITVHNTKSVKVKVVQPALLRGKGDTAGKGAAGAEADAGGGGEVGSSEQKWGARARGEQEHGGAPSIVKYRLEVDVVEVARAY